MSKIERIVKVAIGVMLPYMKKTPDENEIQEIVDKVNIVLDSIDAFEAKPNEG